MLKCVSLAVHFLYTLAFTLDWEDEKKQRQTLVTLKDTVSSRNNYQENDLCRVTPYFVNIELNTT